MVKLHIDGSDVVPDPAVIFSQDPPGPGQEDSVAGEETEEPVPGGEVLLASDLLVEIDGAEPSRCCHHGEEVQYPDVKSVVVSLLVGRFGPHL